MTSRFVQLAIAHAVLLDRCKRSRLAGDLHRASLQFRAASRIFNLMLK